MNGGGGGHFVLHGRPGTGSAPVEALLALAGLPHEIVDVENSGDSDRRRTLLAINPLGQVPVLETPNGVMTESAAIMIYLADLVPGAGFCPAAGDANRPVYLRLMVFLAANIYMNDLRYYYSERYAADPGCAISVHRTAAQRKIAEWDIFESLCAASGLSRDVGALELFAATLADWNEDIAEFAVRCPKVAAMARQVTTNPVVADIWRRHRIRQLPVHA